MHPISRDDLHLAVEHVTGGGVYGAEAYIDLQTGAVLLGGDDMEPPLPRNVRTAKRYLPVPSRKELGLGRDDALAFAEQHAPQMLRLAEAMFNGPGAFQRFKALMHDAGLLPQWHAHQDARLWEALEEWVVEEGLQLAAK